MLSELRSCDKTRMFRARVSVGGWRLTGPIDDSFAKIDPDEKME